MLGGHRPRVAWPLGCRWPRGRGFGSSAPGVSERLATWSLSCRNFRGRQSIRNRSRSGNAAFVGCPAACGGCPPRCRKGPAHGFPAFISARSICSTPIIPPSELSRLMCIRPDHGELGPQSQVMASLDVFPNHPVFYGVQVLKINQPKASPRPLSDC